MNETLYCTQCGATNTAEANFCLKCGQAIAKHYTGAATLQGAQPRPSQSSNFIAKHWRGEYSLGVSYWLFGFLLTLLIIGLSLAIDPISDAIRLGTQGHGVLIVGYYLGILAVSVWQFVGVFRSASAHVSRGGKAFWAILAKVLVCLGAIQMAISVITDGVPILREGVDMIRGTDNIPPYALRLMRNDTELEVAGGLPIGTTDAVRDLLDASPKVRVIHLNSTGGRIYEANKLADLIAQRQLITYTRTSCSSACALAFLAGRERYIGEKGQIGFHSASVHGATGSDDLDVNASFRTALSRVGASPEFITRATTTSPSDMWYPDKDTLKQQHIITEQVDSRYFGLSGLTQWRDANQIEQALLKQPVFAALAAHDADNYAHLRKIVVDGVQSGRSTVEIQAGIQALIATSIVPNYLVRAPDHALLRYWRAQVEEMKFFGKTNPAHCLTFLGLDNNTPKVELIHQIPKAQANEDLAALVDVVEQTAKHPVHAKPLSVYEQDFRRVLMSVMAKDRRAVEIVASPEQFTHEPSATCNSMVLLYDTILSLPDTALSAGLLRSMAAEVANPQ